jgi:ubiquinone biosynthesis protein COQ9
MTNASLDPVISQLLGAALPHVPFDGWSSFTFGAAVQDTGIDPVTARAVCPRGAMDLAVAFHRQGDADMVAAMETQDLSEMRFRDKVALAIWLRLQTIGDKELVRRGSTLFALPHHAAEGVQMIWGTADVIWNTLGDTSEDVNWYTKRMTLSGVYGSVVLFWLGDDSTDHQATRAFIDRRIENVMQIEQIKAQVNKSPILSRLVSPLTRAMEHVQAPSAAPRNDLPGIWTPGK